MEKDQEYFIEVKFSNSDLLYWVDLCHENKYSGILISHFEGPQFYVEVRAALVQSLACPQASFVEKQEFYKRIESLTPFLAYWMMRNGNSQCLSVPNFPDKL